MSVVHRRSQAALARAYILESAFWDRQRSESVCKVSRDDVVAHLLSVCRGEALEASAVPKVLEKGLVLCDSRGEGRFSLLKKPEGDVPVEAAKFVSAEVFGEYRKGIDERCSVHEKQICALEFRQKSNSSIRYKVLEEQQQQQKLGVVVLNYLVEDRRLGIFHSSRSRL